MCEVDCLGNPIDVSYELKEDLPFAWPEEITEVTEVTLLKEEWIRPPCNMPLNEQFASVSSPTNGLFAQADIFALELQSLMMQELCVDE
jgi:hypothetical protein